jgi:hypothetical protein
MRHASAHFADTGHRFVRSFEPGEEWFWDYREEGLYENGPTLAAPEHHPVDQGVPGPADRVPGDWTEHLNA